MFHICACAVLLLGAEASVAESFQLSHLQKGQQFEVHTEDCTYVAELVDRSTGECRMRISDGKRLSEPRTVYLIGATRGVQDRLTFLKMHEVQVGMKLEIGLDDLEEANRAHTTVVTGFDLGPAQ